MKQLKIAQISPLDTSVPPKKYGGTERIVSQLTEGLVKRGHQVTLFASGDSKTKARLIAVIPLALNKIGEKINPQVAHLFSFTKVIERQKEFDIIHNHTGWRFLPFSKFLKTKVVHTYHSYFFERTRFFFKYFKEQPFTFLSKNQRSSVSFLKSAGIVYNGVKIEKFDFCQNPKDYFLFLGRFSPLKGTFEAIQAARKAKVKLIVAAKFEDSEYYQKKVRPYLRSRNIKYVGEIGGKERLKLLKNARGLLFPIQWEEPFGLVMTEAMACGTPVIAFKRGAVPEVVQHGKTGFIVRNVEEMAEKIKKIDRLSRKDCRAWVEENFTAEKMVDGYEKAYYKILAKKT